MNIGLLVQLFAAVTSVSLVNSPPSYEDLYYILGYEISVLYDLTNLGDLDKRSTDPSDLAIKHLIENSKQMLRSTSNDAFGDYMV